MAKEKGSLIFEGEIQRLDFDQFSSLLFPRSVKTEKNGGGEEEGVWTDRKAPHPSPLASPTGMREVTAKRNEPEDSRLPRESSVTSEFADESRLGSRSRRSFIENGGQGQFKGEKEKERMFSRFLIIVVSRKKKTGRQSDRFFSHGSI